MINCQTDFKMIQMWRRYLSASDQITEFILLKDNSLLAMRVEDEKEERNLSLKKTKDIEEILLRKILIAAKSTFDKNLDLRNENFLTNI